MIIKIYLIIITVIIIIIIIILFFYQISQVIFCNTLWTVREKHYINLYYCHYYLLSPVL